MSRVIIEEPVKKLLASVGWEYVGRNGLTTQSKLQVLETYVAELEEELVSYHRAHRAQVDAAGEAERKIVQLRALLDQIYVDKRRKAVVAALEEARALADSL